MLNRSLDFLDLDNIRHSERPFWRGFDWLVCTTVGRPFYFVASTLHRITDRLERWGFGTPHVQYVYEWDRSICTCGVQDAKEPGAA